VVPITDIAVKDKDVVVATQGRSFWILDDTSPLRQISKEAAAEDVHLYKPTPAPRFFGLSVPRPNLGMNPPNGAVLYYSLKAAPKDDEEVVLEVRDKAGALVRKLSSKPKKDAEPNPIAEFLGVDLPSDQLPAKAGLNRFAWNLRGEEASKFKGMILWGGGTDGPVVPPGTYELKLKAAGRGATTALEVQRDPRLQVSDADLQKQYELLVKVRDKLAAAHDAVARIREVRDQVGGVVERAKGTPDEKALADAADAFKKKVTAVEEAPYQTKNKAIENPRTSPIRLNNKLCWLAGVVSGAERAPTEQSYAVYDDVAAKIDAQLAALKQTLDQDLPAFNQLVREKNVPAVVLKEKKSEERGGKIGPTFPRGGHGQQ